jgi:hypothetical protein
LFVQVLSSSSTPATFTALSISNAVPPNAKSIAGSMTFNTGATAATSVMYVAGDSNGLNRELVQFTNNGSTTTSWSAPFNIQITTPQTMYWSSTVTAGTTTFSIEVTRYSI